MSTSSKITKSSKSSSSSSSSSSKRKAPIKSALKASPKVSAKEAKTVSFDDRFKENAREEDSEDDEAMDNVANNHKDEVAKETNQRPPNAGKRWTDKEEDAMVKAFEKGRTVASIAELLGRTERSIEYRAYHLIEVELYARGYFENPTEYEGDAEVLCEKYNTTLDAFNKYVNLNNMRKERRAAHVLAKHNVADAIRQLDDGLYIKVAHVPSTKELREQIQIKDLNAKIDQLQQLVTALTSQLQEKSWSSK